MRVFRFVLGWIGVASLVIAMTGCSGGASDGGTELPDSESTTTG